MTIQLTKGKFAVVDEADFSVLSKYRWKAQASKTRGNFYATRLVILDDGRMGTIYMHREIMGLALGDKRVVDHINGDPLDNRRSNLRVVTHSQNSRNCRRHEDNASGFKGVTHDKSRGQHRARIKIDKKTVFLGRFSTPEEAYAAYCKASAELHGEFGRVA